MAEAASSGNVSLCTLHAVRQGSVTLLDAVTGDAPGIAHLFFTHDTPMDRITPGEGVSVIMAHSVGGAPKITVSYEADGPIPMLFDQVPVAVSPSPRQWDLLDGRNVALAIRNGERTSLVMDWLRCNHRSHGMNGAVILSRARPDSDPQFAEDLSAAIAESGLDCAVLLVDVDHPLGHKTLPSEAHPYCVPEAPGKDRMEIPEPDPWHAPLAEVLYYEWARARYLGAARAVANIDVHDLLPEPEGPGIFDRAAGAQTGYISLQGRHCYPWRVRNGDAPEFADHACVQFDTPQIRRRWCVAPHKLPDDCVWRFLRIGGATPEPDQVQEFYRCMALRHPAKPVTLIVPRSSLVKHPPLLRTLSRHFEKDPVRPPPEKLQVKTNGKRAIVTTMKNEGPFILEWIAYHRAIGIDDFLVYTNDCTDGTDTILDLLQQMGVVQHRENPFRQTDLKPQHAALGAAESEPVISEAEWIMCMDVDEYINIKCGDGTLDALFAELGDVNMISMTWRLFGNAGIHAFDPDFITRQFTRCAPEYTRKPHQAWGFKTLFKNTGIYRKMGVHRPKGLKPQLWEEIRWVNGSGKPMPRHTFRNAWRSTIDSYGYDLVQLNHYAVRSAESFLVKRDRGRVNHVDRDQGLAYWFRMNNNADSDTSIQRMLPRVQAEYDRLMENPELAAAHNAAIQAHRDKIAELQAMPKQAQFYAELTGARMEKLSHMHAHFGANVFLQGPESVPDEVLEKNPDEEFFFTVERGETEH
ncbi:MAG: glycosyltransferase family 2 protein [Ruegeria sp.]|uniref:glycosyltransferase family 2 protein n=1 Tax=Ruegeria sp. TaxID=1879320 RepID=UPI00349E8151